MLQTTDFLLFQFTLGAATEADTCSAISAFCAQSPVPVKLHRWAWAAELKTAYVYFELLKRTALDEGVLPSLVALWSRHCPAAYEVRASRLESVFDRVGHSSHATPAFHYVVEMDPDAGWMPELERWYDTEHMPGLAAVPGCIRASRLYNHDQGPLSLACYDLVTTQTLGSEPWLAVRGTPWSDIVRPHFTHTKRTMFEVLG
jgi:hypothetical protein